MKHMLSVRGSASFHMDEPASEKPYHERCHGSVADIYCNWLDNKTIHIPLKINRSSQRYDVLPSQSLCIVLKKLNLTLERRTRTNKLKDTVTLDSMC